MTHLALTIVILGFGSGYIFNLIHVLSQLDPEKNPMEAFVSLFGLLLPPLGALVGWVGVIT